MRTSLSSQWMTSPFQRRWIDLVLPRFGSRVNGFAWTRKAAVITLSYVVHADETGMKVSTGTRGKAGSKGWLSIPSNRGDLICGGC